MTEQERIEQAIAALEAQRATLGDAVVDASVAALRKQLAEPEPEAAEQKRRQVSVLLADVVGSTAMTERMDAEDVAELMNALWERLDEVIVEHGGLIDKHMGDAVMALWGAKQTREDDPERATHAALAMQSVLATFREERHVSLAMRIAINTGPVLLGQVGTTREFTAMGNTVNVTSRLQHAAPIDGLLISHDTYRHIRGVFDVQPLEPIAVKGKSELIRTYAVQRAKPRAFRLTTRGVEGIETRMIGRDAELKYLQDAFSTMKKDSKLKLVTITGEAGVGKSRLLYEFENWIELLPESTRYFKGHARPELQSRPYAVIRDLFSFRFEILDSDPTAVVRDKMEQGIGEALGWDEQGEMKAHFIGQLLGFGFGDSSHLQHTLDDARQIHDRALMYLGEFFSAMAAQAPTTLFLEDTHWADDSSLELIDQLAQMMTDQRVLIVCLARPILFERRPDWGKGREGAAFLEMRPLSKQNSRRLVAEILQKVKRVPAELRELIVDGTEGNPFFAEELIKMLIDDGVIAKGEDRWHIEIDRLKQIRVPPALTGVLQARLDSLPPEERALLQQASVVGRVFWSDAVRRLLLDSERIAPVRIAQGLDLLRQHELIFHREKSTFADTQEYIFKHAVLRDVTYETVLRRVRRVYHGLIADWLIEHCGERIDEYVGLIADHMELAEQPERAATYLRQAGEQAAKQFANAEAVRYFTRALNLTPQADLVGRYAILLAREKVYDLLGEREAQKHDLETLEELAKALGDDGSLTAGRQAELTLRLANYHQGTSNYLAAIAAVQKAIDLARMVRDANSEATGYLLWGQALLRQSDYDAARSQLEQALRLSRAVGLHRLQVRSLTCLGAVYVEQGDFARAKTYLLEALRICRESGDRRGQGPILTNLGVISIEQGDYAGAKACYEQSLHICREVGNRQSEGIVLGNLGSLLADLGDYAKAKACCEQALRRAHEIHSRHAESIGLASLGLLSHYAGDDETAWRYCQQALAVAQDLGSRRVQGHALTGLGHALVGLGCLEEAADAYQEGVAIRRELEETHLCVETIAGLADVFLRLGEFAQARAQVDEILSYLEVHPVPGGFTQPLGIYLICYHVLCANRDPRAPGVLGTAYGLLQEQSARIRDEELQRSYLENVTAHREIVAEWRGLAGKNL